MRFIAFTNTAGRPVAGPAPPRLAQKHLIIGDAPIYVSLDSADACPIRGFSSSMRTALPLFVAGVPPDFFQRDRPEMGKSRLQLARP
jgi:hypothetical protein